MHLSQTYQFLVKVALGTNDSLNNDSIKLVKEYDMSECQVGKGVYNKHSRFMLKMGAAHSNTDELTRWRLQRLYDTLVTVAMTH